MSSKQEKIIDEIEKTLPLYQDNYQHSLVGNATEFQETYINMLKTRSNDIKSYRAQANVMKTLWNGADRGELIMGCSGDCPLKSLVKVIALEFQNGEASEHVSVLWACINSAPEDESLKDISNISCSRSRLLESFSKYVGVEKVWARVMWPSSIRAVPQSVPTFGGSPSVCVGQPVSVPTFGGSVGQPVSVPTFGGSPSVCVEQPISVSIFGGSVDSQEQPISVSIFGGSVDSQEQPPIPQSSTEVDTTCHGECYAKYTKSLRSSQMTDSVCSSSFGDYKGLGVLKHR